MDPLSITAATVSFAAIVTSGLRKLKQVYGASSELNKLIQDVSELGLVLQLFEDSLSERLWRWPLLQQTTQRLCDVVFQAKKKLQSLQTLIDDKLTKPGSPQLEPKVAKRSWLKFKADVDKIQQDLRESRQNLVAIYETLNLSDASNIQGRLDDLLQWQDEQRSLWAENNRKLQELSLQIAQSLMSAHGTHALPASPQPTGSSTSTASSPGPVPSTLVSSATGTPNSSGNSTPPNPTRTDLIPRRVSDSIISTDPSPDTEDEGRRHSTGYIRATKYRRNYCDGWCSCICHQEQHFQTPRVTEAVTGYFFFGYGGFSQQKCSEKTCRRQTVPILKFLYHFPPWLWQRAVRIALTFSYMNGPQMALSMPRIIPGDAKLFDYAVQGNLEGVKKLFSSGLASPYDVAASNGRTALHYSVVYNHLEMSQYLIDKGADSKLEDKGNDSTVALAWGRIFGNLADASTTNTWRCMFEDEDYLESRNFPSLHKIILRLNGAELRHQLEQTTESIDDRDSEGRTALSWAATRCSTEAVKLLLEFKANPNINSIRNTSPLQFSAQSHSAEARDVMEALLAAGAYVDNVDTFQRTALIYASCNQPDPAYVEPLIRRNAQLNSRDCWGRTPLGYAAKMGNSRTVEFLLSHGADPLIADDLGYSPQFEAVEHNHHLVLEAMHRNLALCNSRTVQGRSFLHCAAIYGDARTFKILTDAAGHFKNENDIIDSGAMLKGAFNQRKDLNDNSDIQPAFRAFIHAFANAGAISVEEDIESYDSDDDEFEDVPEF